jgi:hypothetical protein
MGSADKEEEDEGSPEEEGSLECSSEKEEEEEDEGSPEKEEGSLVLSTPSFLFISSVTSI